MPHAKPKPKSDLLLVSEASRALRTRVKHIRQWCADGQLEHIELPDGSLRIPVSAIESMRRPRGDS